MYRLKTVNLSQNRLTSIPKRFGKLIDITNINLDINHIGPTLPDSICNLWKLHTLKLVKNRLKTLPVNGLMNLTSLTLLNVNSNIIGPTLPEDISYMPNLADLRLSHNRLKTLPVAFCLNDMCTVLKNLWLYGNRIVQLPHEFRFLTSLTDLRIENNPMISPPPELSLQGPARILQYCGDRLERINELKRVLRDNHVRFNQDNLLPESKFVFTEGTDYLSEEDLANFDQQIDRTLNGAYYNHMMDIQALTDFMREKKLERRIAHHKLLLEKFLIFLDIAIEKNRL
jgi:Leucine-rich repeat (LRR) protein